MILGKSLTKKYENVFALDSVDFTILDNKLTYLVGPNGSGKTTLIKCLLGLVKSSDGEIKINQEIINGNYNYRDTIGYMPQVASFPENLTVLEVINMIKEIRNHTKDYDEELIEKFNLHREFKKIIKNLSGGTKQKLNAAIAFLFNPSILILDEPSAGLDPISSSQLKDKIIREREKGKTVLLTSHIINELEELAEEIIFLYEGKVLFLVGKNELIEKTMERNLERAISKLMASKYENFI